MGIEEARVVDLVLLRRFVATATNGSVSRAARELGLSQPSLTWSIKQLEADLGTKLLERSPKGVTVTAAGGVLLERARRIVMEAELARADVAAVEQKRNRELVVASTTPFIAGIAARAVLNVLRQMPDVSVRLVQVEASALAEVLRDPSVDVGFWSSRSGGDFEGFDFETTFWETYVAAVRAGHPLLRSRKPVTLAAALEHEWAMHEYAYRNSAWDLSGEKRGVPRPNARVLVTSEHLLPLLLLESDLIGYMAQDMIRRDLEAGSLRALPIPELTVRMRVGLLVRKNAIYTPPMKLFCREIRMASRGASRA
jgi:DNA-binding transcriptional LysR family regulator